MKYPPTEEIMSELNGLYKELGSVLGELEGLIDE